MPLSGGTKMFFLVLPLVLIAMIIGLGGCTPQDCDSGFVPGNDGNCYASPPGEDSAPDDTAPETGETGTDTDTDTAETGETGDSGATTLRSILSPGAFEGHNVLGVSLDTTAASAVPGAMPNLSALGRAGFVSENHACGGPWTAPCGISVFTGVSAVDAGAGAFKPANGTQWAQVSDETVTLGDALLGVGIATRFRTENATWGRNTNAAQGFGTARYGEGNQAATTAAVLSDVADLQATGGQWAYWYHSAGGHAPYVTPEIPAGDVAACGALPDGVDGAADQAPYQLMALNLQGDELEAAEETMRCLYTAKLRWLDNELFGVYGLLAQLEAQGALDHTIVVVLADHGEAFGERTDPTTDGMAIFGHNAVAYPENLRVPLVFWAKDIEPGSWAEPTDQGDVAPTLLSALDIEIPSDMTGSPVGQAPNDRAQLGYRCGSAGVVGGPVYSSYSAALGGQSVHLDADGAWRVYDVGSDPDQLIETGAAPFSALREAIEDVQNRQTDERWCG